MSGALQDGSDVTRVRLDKARVLSTVARLAEDHGIRVLAAGGPVFVAQGLISPRVSRSAAVIVDRAALSEFVRVMVHAGWCLPPLRRGHFLPSVILSLTSDAWAVDLHVYTAFPGFYTQPQQVFEILWERRQEITFHGADVFTVDRLTTIMLATHDRLGAQSWSPKAHNSEAYLINQFRSALSMGERTELHELVTELGATQPMRPLLVALGLDAGDIRLPTEDYARWRLALPEVGSATLALLAFSECPPQRRFIQTVRMLRQSPGTVARASIGWPRSLWLIGGARKRFREQFAALGKLG